MSPPEVWGPAVWTLFHTLIEKMNPNAYPYVIGSMFTMFTRICKFLPCPECSKDASNFLGKIKLVDYKNKTEFKNLFYLFHNFVNAKKLKRLYNYANMDKYSRVNLIFVVNDFIAKYNTKGNMKLLTESFQRGFVVKDFVNWFKSNAISFFQPVIRPQFITQNTQVNENNVIKDNVIKEDNVIEENNVIEEPLEEKENNVIEETLEEKENDVIEENNEIEETLEEKKNEVIEENNEIEETLEEFSEEPIITKEIIIPESMVIEEHIVIQKPKKKRKNKK